MRYVACLFTPPANTLPKWSRCYTPAWADRFARGVARHSPRAEVVILTDYPADQFHAGQTILPFTLPHRGWAQLIEMFRPEVVGEAAILCGLDTVFVGDLAPVERCVIASGYITPTDPYFPGQPTNAVVGVTAQYADAIWKVWRHASHAGLPQGDEYKMFGAFSEMFWLARNTRTLARFDDALPGAVASYKATIRKFDGNRHLPRPVRIVYFHGQPKPHDLAESGVPWVADHWGPPVA